MRIKELKHPMSRLKVSGGRIFRTDSKNIKQISPFGAVDEWSPCGVQRKAGLATYDDKLFVCTDGVTTLAHGHRKTKLDLNRRFVTSFMIYPSD